MGNLTTRREVLIGMKPAPDTREATVLLDSPKVAALFEKARIAAGGDPIISTIVAPERRGFEWMQVAVPALAMLCVLTWWLYRGSRSPAIALTSPAGVCRENPVIGSTCLYNGDFFLRDNLDSLRLIDWMKGKNPAAAAGLQSREPRIGYAVLGNFLTLCFSSYFALAALNIIVLALGAWLVANATEILFAGDTKAALAAACFVFSVAATTQIGDFSPHLLGMTLFYAWTFLLLRMEIEGTLLSWRSNNRTLGVAGFLVTCGAGSDHRAGGVRGVRAQAEKIRLSPDASVGVVAAAVGPAGGARSFGFRNALRA